MGIKINQYTNETFDIGDNDFYDVDKYLTPSTFQSNKISGATLKNVFTAIAEKSNGSFLSKVTQTCTSGSIKAMEFEIAAYTAIGVDVVNDTFGKATLIQVSKDRVYNIAFSAQLNRTSGGSSKQITIWLRKNGSNIADTATHLSVQANAGKLVAAWNFFVNIAIGDDVQIMWSQNDNIDILAEVADVVLPHPAVPSVILTINEI